MRLDEKRMWRERDRVRAALQAETADDPSWLPLRRLVNPTHKWCWRPSALVRMMQPATINTLGNVTFPLFTTGAQTWNTAALSLSWPVLP